MCALAIMRFLALRIPFKIKKSFITTSGNKAGIMVIIVVWILGSVLAAPNLHFVRLLLNNPEGSSKYCTLWYSAGNSFNYVEKLDPLHNCQSITPPQIALLRFSGPAC